MSDYQVLRQKYPRFIYQSSRWQIKAGHLSAQWHFLTQAAQGEELEFRPSLSLALPLQNQHQLDTQVITNLVFQIGLVEMLSYWKATASPTMIIKAGQLTQKQQKFWQELLIQGMGEYFYLNQIPFWQKSFVNFKLEPTETNQSTSIQAEKPSSSLTLAQLEQKIGKISRLKSTPTGNNQLLGNHQYLIPLGGGKDSIVTLLLLQRFLKRKPQDLVTMAINPTTAVRQTAKTAEVPLIEVNRQLDPQLLKLNQRGFLNGHTPFSALIAFTSTLVAYLHGVDRIALSNESSANEPTLMWHNHAINHQYSKSFDFETKFRHYLQAILAPSSDANAKDKQSTKSIAYFSFLRPLYELQIAWLFTQIAKKYWPIFRSCNVGQKEGIWCGHCPKCLFAFTMIFPFIGETAARSIFATNLFDESSLLPLAYQLVGAKIDQKQNLKPFECVGTKLESLVAFWLADQWYKKRGRQRPFILKQFEEKIFHQYPKLDLAAEKIFHQFNQHHHLPPKLATLLRQQISTMTLTTRPTKPIKIKQSQLDTQKADSFEIIFGLGREGLSSFDFLQQRQTKTTGLSSIILVDDQPINQLSPEWQRIIKENQLKLWSSDELKRRLPSIISQDPDQAKRFRFIKAPGIPQSHSLIEWAQKQKVAITSNTNLFFAAARKTPSANRPLIIGVTGTKGKSTTAALIAHILKQADLPVALGGNLGTPPLDLLKHLFKQTNTSSKKKVVNHNQTRQQIYVLELSSHQLADIKFSPDIAIWLNIYPEHLDYYQSYQAYVKAKAHIFRYQTKDDWLIYFAQDKMIKHWAETARARQKVLTPAQVQKIDLQQTKLWGSHNKFNLAAAIAAAKLVGISEKTAFEASKTFSPLPHRLEKVAVIDGVTYINDSLATNPGATIAALKSFAKQPVILITGGYDRGLSYRQLAETIIRQTNLKAVILLPETGHKILKQLKQLKPLQSTTRKDFLLKIVPDLQAAVVLAQQISQANDVILLSPASASFNQFKDYRERGQRFKQLIGH